MKTKSIITIGLIASATLFQVYGIESAPRRDRGIFSRTVTVTYEEPSPAEATPSLFGNLTESDFHCLEYGGLQAVHILNGGTAGKNTVQVIVVEPYHTQADTSPDRIQVREYMTNRFKAQPEQFSRFSLRQVLLKWAELWSTETRAQPVVLVMHEF